MSKITSEYGHHAGSKATSKFKPFGACFAILSAAALALPVAAQTDCSDRGGQAVGVDEIPLSSPERPADEQPGRVFVSPNRAGQSTEGTEAITRLAQGTGVQTVEKLVYQNTQIWTIPPEQDEELVLAALNDNEFIGYAELDSYRNPHSNPNDTLRCSQWYIDNVADSYYGRTSTPGADLKLANAWNITTGSDRVIIAVIDNGVDLSHPDLANNLWVNSDEIPGNGIDDDLNGYVDDINGWDFNRADNDPDPESSGRNHGTAVAGVFGAVGNNTDGIAGANWNVSIMVLKTDFSVSATIKAMEYAADNGATIINTSFGGSQFSRSEYNAVEALRDFGVLVVASAGNEHWDNDFGPNYPGSYDLPNIIAVAATSTKDDFTSWTQYGQIGVDVAAPGDAIITTEANGSGGDDSYAIRSGTSFASPLVAGVAGLIKSQYPDASYSEIKARIVGSVDPIADAQCAIGSGGRVNALAALEMSKQPVPVLTGIEWADGGNSLPDAGETAVIKLTFETLWGNAGQTSVSIASGNSAIRLLDSELSLPSLADGESFTLEIDARAATNMSGHNRVPLTINFTSPGFAAERTVCLTAAPLKEGQQIETALQTSRLDDVQRFHIEVPEGAPSLKLTLDSSRNVDLYARFGSWPMRDQVLRTGTSYARGETTHISARNAGDEALDITDPKPGTWYVMVVNAEQRSDTQYTLNNNFGRAVNNATEPDTETENKTEQEPEAEEERDTTTTVSPNPAPAAESGGGGGGGAAGWMFLLLLSVRLLRAKPRG